MITASKKLFTEFIYNFLSYKAAGFTCREKSQAAKEFLISKLEEGFRRR